jgi:alkylation response protein AidB-like acyl-CoA dehydrogenase
LSNSQLPDFEEHRVLLRDSVADFIARGTDIARVRRLRGTPAEYERTVWKQMARLGWLGILIPEQHGGLGLGLAEAAIVAEGLGRALAPEPFTAAVLAVETLVGGDNASLKADLLPRIVAGESVPALAWQESPGETRITAVETRAVRFEGGYRLNGSKRFIAGAAGADGYVVSAQADKQQLALFWVASGTPGVTLQLETLADGRHFGALALSDVAVPRDQMIASNAVACRTLERAIDHAAVIASAELYGVMSRALEMTLDYLKTRVQFGKPIGSFQALQHHAVDLYIQQQLASAVLDDVIAALDQEPDSNIRGALASRVKARCSDAALKITRAAIQLHGAIAFTDEYDAGLYLKRAMVLAAWLGGATSHRRRYAQLTIRESA